MHIIFVLLSLFSPATFVLICADTCLMILRLVADGAILPVSQDQWTKLGSFQLLQLPGTGSGAEQWIEPQHLVGQPGPSQYSLIPHNGGKVNGTAEYQDEKKKMKDKKYRERCRVWNHP